MGDSHGGKSSHVDKDSSRMFSASLFVNGMTIATRVFRFDTCAARKRLTSSDESCRQCARDGYQQHSDCPAMERKDSGISFRERFSVIREDVPACVDAAKSTVE